MKFRLIVLVSLIIAIGFLVKSSGALSGFNYYIEYEITNTGTQTISSPINIEVNAAGMVDGHYIKEDASDVRATYLGVEEPVTAMDLTSGSATWRLAYTSIPPGGQVQKTMWIGNNTATRDQSWIAAPGDVCTQINPGSFAFPGTQPFAIQAIITPVTYPGTKQLIIGKGNSWKLELYPQSNITEEPWYKWSVLSGSGNLIHSATISAHPHQTANIWAWYNGESIVISDGHYNKSAILPTGLVVNGSPVLMASADIVIDHLRITTPGSIAAPAGGAPPPGSTKYTLGPDINIDLPDNPVNSDYASEDSSAASYLANGVTIESDPATGYGWVYSNDSVYANNAFAITDYPGGSNDAIIGVSLYVSGWVVHPSYHAVLCPQAEAEIYGTIKVGNDSYSYATDTVIGSFSNATYYYYRTGTRTLAPNGQPWTADHIDNLVVYPSIYSYCSDSTEHLTELKIYVSVE